MTDHITTEEAERIAEEITRLEREGRVECVGFAVALDAAFFLRSLAAERDRLAEENAVLRKAVEEQSLVIHIPPAQEKRMVEMRAEIERLRGALRPVVHEYDLWAADVNDGSGEFRLWDLDRLCSAIVNARAALGDSDAV